MSSRQIRAIGPRRPSSLAVMAAPAVRWMSGLPSLELWGTWISACWPENIFNKAIVGAALDTAYSTGRQSSQKMNRLSFTRLAKGEEPFIEGVCKTFVGPKRLPRGSVSA
eukprot:2033786-Alexandrium_andersonii.AAC.1